jgi:subtilisin family serine protease
MRESNLGHSIGMRGLGAPGDAVTSLSTAGPPLTLGGTSVAAPFVTGAIALLWSKFSAATAAEIRHARLPHFVRLPGFVSDENIGIGDVIKRATSYIGIKSCGGCEHRAAALNRWMVFTKRASSVSS